MARLIGRHLLIGVIGMDKVYLIQKLNVIWIFSSFIFLAISINRSQAVLFNAIIGMVVLWMIFYYIGRKDKLDEMNRRIFSIGEKPKGQWDKVGGNLR